MSDNKKLAQEPAKRETLAEWAMRATPDEVNRTQWRLVAGGMRKMIADLEAEGCHHSGYRVFLGIAESEGKEPEQPRPSPVAPAVPEGDKPRDYLHDADLGDLMRFQETSEDGEGYDIGKYAIKRLAELGVVQSHGFGKYSITAFGDYVLEHTFLQKPSLPLKTVSEINTEKPAAMQAAGESK